MESHNSGVDAFNFSRYVPRRRYEICRQPECIGHNGPVFILFAETRIFRLFVEAFEQLVAGHVRARRGRA